TNTTGGAPATGTGGVTAGGTAGGGAGGASGGASGGAGGSDGAGGNPTGGASGASGASGAGGAAPACSGKPGGKRGKSTQMVMAGGAMRSFVYYAPMNLDANKAVPIVIIPHGFTMNGEAMYTITGYDKIADR